MIKIIDNFLSNEDWNVCINHFSGDNWRFPSFKGEVQGTKVWRIFKPKIEEEIGALLYAQLQKHIDAPCAVKRVGINGSTALIDSHIHVDGKLGDMSLVWFASPKWNEKWNGRLRIYKDPIAWTAPGLTKNPSLALGIDLINYVPNRAVLFPAHLAHIPETPSIYAKNKLRVTVGLHLEPSDQWLYKYIPRTNNGYI
jgi:hypothetical protein